MSKSPDYYEGLLEGLGRFISSEKAIIQVEKEKHGDLIRFNKGDILENTFDESEHIFEKYVTTKCGFYPCEYFCFGFIVTNKDQGGCGYSCGKCIYKLKTPKIPDENIIKNTPTNINLRRG